MASVRAVRVERPSWANLRTALGLLLFCVALLSGQRLIVSAQDTVQVWVAARDLPAETVLSEDDLRAEDVRLSDRLAGRYAAADTALDGRVLARPLLAGEMVAASLLLDSVDGEGGRTMTLPLEGAGGAAGGIGLGDRIDVIATFDAGDVRSKTVPVVRSAEVVDVVTSQGLVEGSDVVGLTIDVPDELVGMVAFAIHNAAIDVVRVDGESGSSDGWSITRNDF
ncbi:MAG: SAF domain-containing protein [Actinomycetota bacterium]